MQITISGDIGSGKSSLGEYLAERFNLELIDCGQLCRKYAASKDVSITQLYQSDDNWIDKQVDSDLIRMGREDKDRVYVSRTGWHFIPQATSIYMHINPELAAARMLSRKSIAEDNKLLAEVLSDNKARTEAEDIRYMDMYGVTRKQQIEESNIIICVGNNDLGTVCSVAESVINKNHILCFDPKIAIPTQTVFEIETEAVEKYKESMIGYMSVTDVRIKLVNGKPYIQDGHHRVAAACLSGVRFVCTHNFEVAEVTGDILRNTDYYDWEDFVKGDLSAVTK